MKRDCSVCDEPIPAKRLAARPEATRCIACQTVRDLTPYEALGNKIVLAVGSELDGEMFAAIQGRV